VLGAIGGSGQGRERDEFIVEASAKLKRWINTNA
jgi:hypothetical protein